VERGDTYGPVTYLLYVPFEQALPWSGRWDDLPAAHGAAIVFELLALGGLLLLGRRMRPGREGALLGAALGYAWVAYPYTTFALESNSNDTLVAVACVGALLAATLARDRAAAAVAGLAIGLGAAAKFVTVALAPLFARRSPAVTFGALLLAVALVVAPFIPDGGVRELYDRTVGYQASRPSPFSIWGQVESLDWLQNIAKGAAAGLAILAAFRPDAPDLRQTAAMGAAILIAVELTATHWFYLYVVWFVPFILVALMAAHTSSPPERPDETEAEREAVFA
jgi:Glycosyltransferase family 87